jgi:hypothetical protein
LGDPDIVDDEVEISLRNDLAGLIFDLLENALRRFDARRGGRADVKLDLAAVDRGKESRPTRVSMKPPSARIRTATTGTIQRRFRSNVSARI